MPLNSSSAVRRPLSGAVRQPPPPPLPRLSNKRVAFTTPPNYAPRLSHLLSLHHATPLHFPTVIVDPTPSTLAALKPYVSQTLNSFSALAFTSRAAIAAFSLALPSGEPPLRDAGEDFTVSALGKDADLLLESGLVSRLCGRLGRVRVLVPQVASPRGMVEALGDGVGRKVLCPVPEVVGLTEPPVVPDFVRDLAGRGWVPVRVPAYETRWAGLRCAEGLVGLDGALDAVVFTSSAEVEGLLKGLEAVGWDWGRVGERWPEMVVAAHGPVTAEGAERLGVEVDVVGKRFGSFDGVLEALELRWSG